VHAVKALHIFGTGVECWALQTCWALYTAHCDECCTLQTVLRTGVDAGHCKPAGHCTPHTVLNAVHCKRYSGQVLYAGHCKPAGHCTPHTCTPHTCAECCTLQTVLRTGVECWALQTCWALYTAHCDECCTLQTVLRTGVDAGHCKLAGHCTPHTCAECCTLQTVLRTGVYAGHCKLAGHCTPHTVTNAVHCKRYSGQVLMLGTVNLLGTVHRTLYTAHCAECCTLQTVLEVLNAGHLGTVHSSQHHVCSTFSPACFRARVACFNSCALGHWNTIQ